MFSGCHVAAAQHHLDLQRLRRLFCESTFGVTAEFPLKLEDTHRRARFLYPSTRGSSIKHRRLAGDEAAMPDVASLASNRCLPLFRPVRPARGRSSSPVLIHLDIGRRMTAGSAAGGACKCSITRARMRAHTSRHPLRRRKWLANSRLISTARQ